MVATIREIPAGIQENRRYNSGNSWPESLRGNYLSERAKKGLATPAGGYAK
ncbi:MAG: hypothetical protein IH594_09815 [Bacteroidales bacterium]|nr:hypothetical protein [Bacteroidales bacterium]